MSTKSVSYLLTTDEAGEEQITAFLSSSSTPMAITSDHANFKKVRDELRGGEITEERLHELLDISLAVSKKFERLSERVTVANHRVYFDGDEVHSSISDHIIRCLDADVEDYKPLVAFLEKVGLNPNSHSREQLYDWLSKRDFTILDDGDFVAYKGVARENGKFVSINQGSAFVNDEAYRGAIPNPVGAVIEMPRSEVQHDPSNGCSTGLHVGSYGYATSFARDALLKVRVNPRDVVSVPTDSNAQKMRVCRYTVIEHLKDALKKEATQEKRRPAVTPIDPAQPTVVATGLYSAMTRDNLRKLVKERGLKGVDTGYKEDMVHALALEDARKEKLESLTRDQLRKRAKELGLTGYGKLSKGELILLIARS